MKRAGAAEGVDGNADLRAKAAARTPDRLIFTSPFLAPAACWCARTMVESMIRCSRSGFSQLCESRLQTPFLPIAGDDKISEACRTIATAGTFLATAA